MSNVNYTELYEMITGCSMKIPIFAGSYVYRCLMKP